MVEINFPHGLPPHDTFEYDFDDALNGVAPKTGICSVSR